MNGTRGVKHAVADPVTARPPAIRLVFLCHSKEVGGSELYLERLLTHAAAAVTAGGGRAQQVELICRPDPIMDAWVQRVAAGGVRVHRLALRRPRDYQRLMAIVKGASLLHVNLAFPMGLYQLLGAVLGRLLARRVVLAHHLVLEPSHLDQWRFAGVPWSRLFLAYRQLGHRHIVLSRHAQQLLISRYRFPVDKTTLIYNGVDTRLFKPLSEEVRGEVKRAMGETLVGQAWREELVVISVSRLSPQKGLFDLIEAAAQVLAQSRAVRFVVVGEGELRNDLGAAISKRSLEPFFFLAGARPARDVAVWLAASDVFVLASHYEGVPFALMEAMACGSAVVSTDAGGVTEALADERCGLVVAVRDTAGLASSLLTLLRDASMRRAMGEAARERAAAAFTVERSLEATLALYRSLLPPESARQLATREGIIP
jgi:glycosyltransferase involved in cell wall biosynthesis